MDSTSVKRSVVVGQKGTYSIHYFQDGYEIRALDWSWKRKGKWTTSHHDGAQWLPFDENPEEMRQALLRHFGLRAWENEFPFDHIVKISPCELAKKRRGKETQQPLCLPRLTMVSDTLGYHIDAENHPDE